MSQAIVVSQRFISEIESKTKDPSEHIAKRYSCSRSQYSDAFSVTFKYHFIGMQVRELCSCKALMFIHSSGALDHHEFLSAIESLAAHEEAITEISWHGRKDSDAARFFISGIIDEQWRSRADRFANVKRLTISSFGKFTDPAAKSFLEFQLAII